MDGAAFIGYCATLSWQPLSVHYESMLVHPDQEGTRASMSLRAPAPSLSAGVLEWHSDGLGLTGTWRTSSAPAVRTLFSSPEGEVVWSCHMPHAHAHVHFDNGMEYTGLGYAEHLLLTIAPWRLPIAILRWGRFLSERESLVWIDWQGPSAQTIVYRNSEPVHAACIEDDRVELSGGARLTLDRSQVLRTGPLGATVLRAVPGINNAAPARVLAVEECKWLSRGVMKMPAGPEEHGWAIHEVVRWPSD